MTSVATFDLESVEVRSLPVEFIHDAAVLATAAFIDNPLFSYIYGSVALVRRFEL
jgi:hypothetical protein